MSLHGLFPIERWDFSTKSFFPELNEEDRQQLMRRARPTKYKKGTRIFAEGATPIGIYYIESGTVKKYKIDNDGKEHILYLAEAGELIGYHAVLAGEAFPDSASALQDCTVSLIPLADFHEVLDRSERMAKQLLKVLSHEFSVYINNLSVFAQRNVRERIAIALIILREKFKQGIREGERILISVTRDDIANMAGTTRENVARVLTELKQADIIKTVGRKIDVLDVRKLVELSNHTIQL